MSVHECEQCGFEAKSAQGLGSHKVRKHSSRAGSMVDAVELTIEELGRLGRFEQVDAATVQSLRSMAGALDQDVGNSALWREFRETLGQVRHADDDADDGVSRALAQIGSIAALGDTETT